MVLSFGQKGSSKREDVGTLIAKKSYAKAIDLIKEQLKSPRGADPRLRMQLADVLVLAGKGREAVMILTPLADEFAREGFAAKAIAVLKKIQKIDPSRRDVEAKLAGLIQEKQQQASSVAAAPGPALEIGMEEIGFEPPAGGPLTVPVAERPALHEPPPAEISFVEPAAPAPPAPAPPPPPARVPVAELEVEEAGIELEPEPELEVEPARVPPPQAERPIVVLEPEPEATLEPEPELSLDAEPLAIDAGAGEPEFALDDEEEFQLESGTPAGEALPEAAAPELEPEAEQAEPLTDNVFVDELMSVLEDAFPSGLGAPISQPSAPPQTGAAQIVVSPLFRHFSVDEMVAVIAGLNLRSCERGQVIIREGDPGQSLFMLSSGKVKAFRKSPSGKQVPIAVLEEGAFFGEGSILTGKPRAASIVALEECELLELDRATLDSIVQQHPHVMDVMREFAAQRAVGK